MKKLLILTIFVIPYNSIAADTEKEKDVQLEISDFFSRCAAVYDEAATTYAKNNNKSADIVKKKKEQSLALASKAAEKALKNELNNRHVKTAARDLSSKNFKVASDKIKSLYKSDKTKYLQSIKNSIKRCGTAISNPEKFANFMRVRSSKP